jgi:hypothetical protein
MLLSRKLSHEYLPSFFSAFPSLTGKEGWAGKLPLRKSRDKAQGVWEGNYKLVCKLEHIGPVMHGLEGNLNLLLFNFFKLVITS